jgi:hypothetical protein
LPPSPEPMPKPSAAASRTPRARTPIKPLPPATAHGRPPTPPAAPNVAPAPRSTWALFRGVPAPALGTGNAGVDVGTEAAATAQAHIYAWGPKGADWSRTGRWLARFDDRFSFPGVLTTAASGSVWHDEIRAGDALGIGPGPTVNWYATLDPSGQAALLVARRGLNRADIYAIAVGEAILPWQDADGGVLPDPTSVVRLGSTWYFLHAPTAPAAASGATVYRVDIGVARKLQRFPRIALGSGEASPKLIRRAGGRGLGLLVLGSPGFGQAVRDWYVLPLDPETGALEEPQRLFGSDLEGQIPRHCRADEDGWIVDTALSLPPATRVISLPDVSLSAIELRLRLEPGTACVESMAARTDALGTAAHSRSDATPLSAATIPMMVTDRGTGRRWELRCGG